MTFKDIVKFNEHILIPCGVAEYCFRNDYFDFDVDLVEIYIDVTSWTKVAVIDGALITCPDKGRRNAFLRHYSDLKYLEWRPKRGRKSNSKNKIRLRIERNKKFVEEELPF